MPRISGRRLLENDIAFTMKDVALAMLMKQAGERLKTSLLEAISGLDEHEDAGS